MSWAGIGVGIGQEGADIARGILEGQQLKRRRKFEDVALQLERQQLEAERLRMEVTRAQMRGHKIIGTRKMTDGSLIIITQNAMGEIEQHRVGEESPEEEAARFQNLVKAMQAIGLDEKTAKRFAAWKVYQIKPETAPKITKVITPDAKSPSGFSTVLLEPDETGKPVEVSRMPAAPPASAGGRSTEAGWYKTAQGEVVPAYRDPVSHKIFDTRAGNELTGGEFYGTPHEQTTSQGTSFQVVMDPKTGNASIVQVPVFRTSQKVPPGTQALPQPAGTPRGVSGNVPPSLPEGSRMIGLKPELLSPQAKQTLATATAGMEMADSLESSLQDSGIAEDNSISSRSKMTAEWIKYKMGFAVDPPFDSIIPTASLLRIMLTTQYLRGIRNFNWIEQIGKHLPSPTDTPRLMTEKIGQLRKNLPLLVNAIRRTEQPGLITKPPSRIAGKPKENEERVSVISPNGTPGTVPRSQLGEALREGYKVPKQ